MEKEINWAHVKSEYENTVRSVRSIAAENKITHTAIQKKAKKEHWKKLDIEIFRDKELIETASFLGKTAIRKIKELIHELGDDYSPIDEPLIIIYAKNYELWIELQEEIKVSGIVCTSPKGGTYLSAAFNASKSVEKTLTTIANSFGLSLSSRKRLGLESGIKDDGESLFNFANMSNYDDIDV